MQHAESPVEQAPIASRAGRIFARRGVLLAAIPLVLLIAALVVPLINMSRFQRRIISSLSASLGRPIHLDHISLTLLPLPGLTIDNLVVSEDPAFGDEPFVRASAVHARLRVSSLWRRRIEFARISFTDPSINLVKTRDGKWNVESILLQAARMEAAPTGQARASAAPRFPYIEATGARLNLKLEQEKTPFSLTEAEFALWLQSPQEWRLRLNGRPLRTDTSVSEIGSMRLEGTLGRAGALSDVPVDLRAEWRNAPLGETSRVVLGRDAGLRGMMSVTTSLRGTLGKGAVLSTLHVSDLRRADFVPQQALVINAECQAGETDLFRAVMDLRCSFPPATPETAAGATTVALTGALPDLRKLTTWSFDLGTPGIPAGTLLDWLRVASSRIQPEVAATGMLAGSVGLRPGMPSGVRWVGQMTLAKGRLLLPSVSTTPVFAGDAVVRSTPGGRGFVLLPVELDLGEKGFATLEGRFDGAGYSLHLRGTALPGKLLALGAALPQVGDGLPEVLPEAESAGAIRFDLLSTRVWGGPQTWTSRNVGAQPVPERRGRRHR